MTPFERKLRDFTDADIEQDVEACRRKIKESGYPLAVPLEFLLANLRSDLLARRWVLRHELMTEENDDDEQRVNVSGRMVPLEDFLAVQARIRKELEARGVFGVALDEAAALKIRQELATEIKH